MRSTTSRRTVADGDATWMRLALAEARKGLGRTRPNPAVGAVIVRGGRVIARGHHRRAGLPHAEREAMARARGAMRGATLYVTLEPCVHVGRTGPCLEAVVASGIKRVVIGCRDRNPLVDGRGIAGLRRAGIAVTTDCLEAECHALYRAFFCWIGQRRPYVTLKAASSLDGIIGEASGRAGRVRWLTGVPARKAAHALRAQHDAILVGVGTVLSDDPLLTIREGASRVPSQAGPAHLRVVLDSHLRTPPHAKIFGAQAPRPPLIVAAAARAGDAGFARRRRALERRGAKVVTVPADGEGRPRLRDTLRLLARREIQSLLVEGGARIHAAFIRARLVDRAAMFVAPRLVGGGVPVAAGVGSGIERALALSPLRITRIGDDILIEAEVVAGKSRRRGRG